MIPKIRLRDRLQWFVLNVVIPFTAMAFAVWLTREVPPTEVFGIYPLKTWVQPGEDLPLRFVGKRNRACPVVSHEELIDAEGRAHRLPSRLGNPTSQAGEFDVETHAPVPQEAAEGLATFRTQARYDTDFVNFCFRPWTIGAPQRPDVKIWIGKTPPPWLTRKTANATR